MIEVTDRLKPKETEIHAPDVLSVFKQSLTQARESLQRDLRFAPGIDYPLLISPDGKPVAFTTQPLMFLFQKELLDNLPDAYTSHGELAEAVLRYLDYHELILVIISKPNGLSHFNRISHLRQMKEPHGKVLDRYGTASLARFIAEEVNSLYLAQTKTGDR